MRKALLRIDDLSDKDLAEIKSGYLALTQKKRGPRGACGTGART